MGGTVVTYYSADAGARPLHEREAHEVAGRRLAALRGACFAGEFHASHAYPPPLYVVACDTLVGPQAASALGIASERDLFGGIVPHAFVATKAITHPLLAPDAAAPAGWSARFAEEVREVVPAGYTVFDPADGRTAARILLANGPVRLKSTTSSGGHRQRVIRTADEMDAQFAALDAAQIGRDGLVLEQQLENVRTFSVGQVSLDDLTISYIGVQTLTSNNAGRTTYGGSDLTFLRGDMTSLLDAGFARAVAEPVAQALRYDRSAFRCYAGLRASRRNYDVIVGTAADGTPAGGVLEQSWRIGGATPAEIAALEAFRAEPGRHVLRAASVERYGEGIEVPPGATIYFRGCDDRLGPMIKYARIEP